MMGGAPVIEWLRPGVGYEPAAARSMRRLEAALGRAHDCNSSYRDYGLQEDMWKAWEAWVAGRGPKPNHSRAIAPWLSKHCMGLADDSDDWTTPGYIALAAEHGWIRTAADDPTERHHFEYQEARDQHRNDPVPSGNNQSEEDDMTPDQSTKLDAVYSALFGPRNLKGVGGKPMIWQNPDGQREAYYGVLDIVIYNQALIRAQGSALQALATAQGADPAAIQKLVEDAVREAMGDVSFAAVVRE